MNWMEINKNIEGSKGHVITSYAESIGVKETYKMETVANPENGHIMLAGVSNVDNKQLVDTSILTAAYEEYCISPNLEDYVITEVPIVEGDVPNRNMNCFLTSRLVKFLPEFGCMAYQTFIGKPTFTEHNHDDHKLAKGIIFDATMQFINGRKFVFLLKGFDRTKDPKLADDILNKKRKGHSMSAWANFFDCSICGHRHNAVWENACKCLKGSPEAKGRFSGKGTITAEGNLVYDAPDKFHFFESSSVSDPANYVSWQRSQVTL